MRSSKRKAPDWEKLLSLVDEPLEAEEEKDVVESSPKIEEDLDKETMKSLILFVSLPLLLLFLLGGFLGFKAYSDLLTSIQGLQRSIAHLSPNIWRTQGVITQGRGGGALVDATQLEQQLARGQALFSQFQQQLGAARMLLAQIEQRTADHRAASPELAPPVSEAVAQARQTTQSTETAASQPPQPSVERILQTEARFYENGSVGPVVRDIQQQLHALGYFSGEVDGRFGSDTTLAVQSFQKAKGLRVDGVVGEQTLNRLFFDQ